MVSSLHIIPSLRINHKSCLVLDTSYDDINLYESKSDKSWTAFNRDAKDAKPHNSPKPLCKKIELRIFVDLEHAGDKTNRCSCTRYMIFMNMSMVDYHTKKNSLSRTLFLELWFLP